MEKEKRSPYICALTRAKCSSDICKPLPCVIASAKSSVMMHPVLLMRIVSAEVLRRLSIHLIICVPADDSHWSDGVILTLDKLGTGARVEPPLGQTLCSPLFCGLDRDKHDIGGQVGLGTPLGQYLTAHNGQPYLSYRVCIRLR